MSPRVSFFVLVGTVVAVGLYFFQVIQPFLFHQQALGLVDLLALTELHPGQLELVPERCIAFQSVECGVCARVCPLGEQAIGLDDAGRPVLYAEGCVGCGVCVRACVTTPSSLRLHLTF